MRNVRFQVSVVEKPAETLTVLWSQVVGAKIIKKWNGISLASNLSFDSDFIVYFIWKICSRFPIEAKGIWKEEPKIKPKEKSITIHYSFIGKDIYRKLILFYVFTTWYWERIEEKRRSVTIVITNRPLFFHIIVN